jgi:hypothetical protein
MSGTALQRRQSVGFALISDAAAQVVCLLCDCAGMSVVRLHDALLCVGFLESVFKPILSLFHRISTQQRYLIMYAYL